MPKLFTRAITFLLLPQNVVGESMAVTPISNGALSNGSKVIVPIQPLGVIVGPTGGVFPP